MAKGDSAGASSSSAGPPSASGKSGSGKGKPSAGHSAPSSGSEVPARRAAKALQAKMLINSSLTTVAEGGDAFVLLETIEVHLPDMNDINLATALHRLAKLSTRKDSKYLELVRQSAIFQKLHSTISARILKHSLRSCNASMRHQNSAGNDMPVQCLSVIAWSHAVMQLLDYELFMAINEIASPRTHEFQPFELCQLVWSFAQAEFFFHGIFSGTERRMLSRRPGELKGLCLAMTAWSFATAKFFSRELFSSLAADLPQHASDLRPQELAQTMWAFAEVRVDAPELYQALGWSAAAPLKLKAFKPQELANAIWAYAVSEQQHPAFFLQAGLAIVQKQSSFSPQNIATLLWGYARLQVPDSAHVLASLLDALVAKLPNFPPGALAKALVSAVELRTCTARLLSRVAEAYPAEQFRETLLDMPAQGLTDLAMVCVGAESSPLVLFEGLVEESVRRGATVDAPALMETLYCSLAASLQPRLTGSTGGVWVAAIAQALVSKIEELSPIDKEKLRSVLRTFRDSPEIGSAGPLRAALEQRPQPAKARPKNNTSDFDSTRTATSMISTACPSDKGLDPGAIRQTSKTGSAESEDSVWESIRQQSLRRQAKLGMLEPIPSMDRAIAKVAALARQPRDNDASARDDGSQATSADAAAAASPSAQDELEIFEEDNSPDPRRHTDSPPPLRHLASPSPSPAPAFALAPAPREERQTMRMSELLVERRSEGRPLDCAEAAGLALSVLAAADAAAERHGAQAVGMVAADSIVIDVDSGSVWLEKPRSSAAIDAASALNKLWASPEELRRGDDNVDLWSALSWRLGLLLRCALGMSAAAASDDGDDVVPRIAAEKGGSSGRLSGPPLVSVGAQQGLPRAPAARDSIGQASCRRLLLLVVRHCLREDRPEPPARIVVETSLGTVAAQARFATAKRSISAAIAGGEVGKGKKAVAAAAC